MFKHFLTRIVTATAVSMAGVISFSLIEIPWAKANRRADVSELSSFSAVLHYVADGDSFVVKNNGTKISIRLWGIDAPEYDQPYSQAAKNSLKRLISGKILRIIPKDIDKYGRIVAVVKVENRTVNSALLASGSAWVHHYFCNEPICGDWYELQEKARNDKSGLWRGHNVVEPWVWKKKK